MTVIQLTFGSKGFPRRIEDDPMFNGWNKNLPRLWFLDQRQATRLDAESLFGASQYAVVYSRFTETILGEVTEVGIIGERQYTNTAITDIGIPAETVARHLILTRSISTVLAQPIELTHLVRGSGGPVQPIVHPYLGASGQAIGEPFPPSLTLEASLSLFLRGFQ